MSWSIHKRRAPSDESEGILAICIGGVLGLILAGVAYPYYRDISLWIGPVIFLMALNLGQIPHASRRGLCLPQFAILVAGLQLVMTAWASHYYPHPDELYVIGDRLAPYLDFTAPLFAAIYVGWNITCMRLPARPLDPLTVNDQFTRPINRELDILFWGGLLLFASGIWRYVPGGLGFVVRLIADLRFVAVVGYILGERKGWQWRLTLVLGSQFIHSTQTGLFHDLILWGLCLLAIYWFRFPRRRMISMVIVVVGVIMLPILEYAKNRMRYALWYGHMHVDSMYGDNLDVTPYNHGLIYGLYFAEGATLFLQGDLPITLVTSRHNQGWIINRIMLHVPAKEPYAKGETLVTALEAAFLPRVISANKYLAGGAAYMQRFANFELNAATSMNIGWAGEMYANFGQRGGIAGCFVLVVLLGSGIRIVARLSMRHPMWWALVPYAGQQAIKAEEGIGEIANWVVKASIIFVLLFYSGALPHARKAMFTKQRQSSRRRTQRSSRERIPTQSI